MFCLLCLFVTSSRPLALKQHPGAATDTKASNGGTVWNCSKALTSYLEHQTWEALDGADLIELGAGTGLSGLAAAVLGARVTYVDVGLPSVVCALVVALKYGCACSVFSLSRLPSLPPSCATTQTDRQGIYGALVTRECRCQL